MLGALAFVVALLYAKANWYGKSAWETYKAELEAKGETFDINKFIPPPVPDDQNILKTPIMETWMYQSDAETILSGHRFTSRKQTKFSGIG